MPDDDNSILEYLPGGTKSLRGPFIIYPDLECLLQKINSCSNNNDKSYTEKKAMQKPSGYSLLMCCSFDKTKNEKKHYRGKDCMKIFSRELKNQAMKIINYEMKEMIPLTDEEKESYEIRKYVIYVNKNFVLMKMIRKNF